VELKLLLLVVVELPFGVLLVLVDLVVVEVTHLQELLEELRVVIHIQELLALHQQMVGDILVVLPMVVNLNIMVVVAVAQVLRVNLVEGLVMVAQVFKFLQHSEIHLEINSLLVLVAQTSGLLVVVALVLDIMVVLALDHLELVVIREILQAAHLMLEQEMVEEEMQLLMLK